MEVDEPTASGSSSAAAASGAASTSGPVLLSSDASKGQNQGSLTVALHPLVIMNVSEHWTRTKAQSGMAFKVYGAIIGKQKGRHIEVMNSFELDYTDMDGSVVIDRDYYQLKESQFKQVFSDLDFLGWYSTGESPTDADLAVHRQICEINESPLFLQLNPAAKHTDLPVSMFESIIDVVNGETRMLFVKLTYTLATEEAERIGLDHVARISGGNDETKSKVAEHLLAQHSAIKMLASRIRIILDYVKAVETGELKHNQEILREAKALSDRLPVLESGRFKPDFYTECNDAALLAYLGTVMKSCNNLNQFVNKFNVLHSRHGQGRRMRNIFF